VRSVPGRLRRGRGNHHRCDEPEHGKAKQHASPAHNPTGMAKEDGHGIPPDFIGSDFCPAIPQVVWEPIPYRHQQNPWLCPAGPP